jgi:hypothetical protein
MLRTIKVYLTRVLPDKGCGFAVDIETGDRAYIAPNFVFKFKLTEGTVADVRVIPNSIERTNTTKWQVVGLVTDSITRNVDADFHVVEEETPRVTEAKMEDRILSLLSELNNQYAHRAADIADKLDAENDEVQAALGKLHRDGEIWEAKICRLGTQKKASYCLWALDDDWFIPEFE